MIPDSGIMLYNCSHLFMLTGLRCCWQYRALSISRSFNITLLQYRIEDFEQAVQISLRVFSWDFSLIPLLQEGQKNTPVICCKKKKKYSKYRAFLILACDKLRLHLQSDWKSTSIIISLLHKRDKTQNQWIYAKNSCCVQLSLVLRERVNQNCMRSFFPIAWLLTFTKSFAEGGCKGLRWCGFARFLMRFIGHFYFKSRYCGFTKPSGLRYLEIFG